MSEYLFDNSQTEVAKNQILHIFGNVCSEMNENLKEAVIKRGNILNYLTYVADELSMNANYR